MRSLAPESITVVPAQRLSHLQRNDIELLAESCRRQNQLEVPLHLEPPRARDAITHFIAQKGDSLVGFASLDDSLEALGLVHPEQRRRGFGRALLSAIVRECQARGAQELLIVLETASRTGRAFAEAAGATYRFSEHRMELDRQAFDARRHVTTRVTLLHAKGADVADLAAIRSASFDRPAQESQAEISRWLHDGGQRLFVAKSGSRTVGMVRLASFQSSSFVNSLAVSPGKRGRGLGSAILEAAVETLIGDGPGPILLEVETQNRRALSIYERCGFRETSTYRYYALSVSE